MVSSRDTTGVTYRRHLLLERVLRGFVYSLERQNQVLAGLVSFAIRGHSATAGFGHSLSKASFRTVCDPLLICPVTRCYEPSQSDVSDIIGARLTCEMFERCRTATASLRWSHGSLAANRTICLLLGVSSVGINKSVMEIYSIQK